ncbi:hypothetical protein AFL01nite_27330 [Aeromicrobium flavum]|uniref:Endonuclease/exonuclease/phosphatase domain-containing protein n=1 Tax=Aeromicrobium flavum TaxID=416568 RepID=A0A512HY69_9ACTN|nr:hypothetical protein AFL01nite_27330 [Aeromicrobium flavum]
MTCAAGLTVLTAPAEAASSLPTPTNVQAADLGGGQVAVTWDRISGSGSYLVGVSPDKSTTQWSWLDAGVSGTTINLNATLRAVPSSGRYYVVVRARSRDEADRATDDRASAFSPWLAVNAVSESIPRYKVGSYNVLSATSSHVNGAKDKNTFPWAKRGSKVISTLANLDLDVFAIQEDNGPIATKWGCAPPMDASAAACLDPKNGSPSHLLAKVGGEIPVSAPASQRLLIHETVAARLGTKYSSYLDPSSSEGRIFWRASKFDRVRGGAFTDLYAPNDYEGVRDWTNWVVLQDRARPASRVFVVSIHTASSTSLKNLGADPDAAHRAFFANVDKKVKAANTEGLPVLLMGDFNSPTRSNGGLDWLRRNGYGIANDDAATRINPTYRSVRSFLPSKVPSQYPYDHVAYKPGSGTPVQAVASWVVARTRLADGERWQENCLGVTNKTVIATAGCIGSDHVPVMASLRW